MYLSFGRYGTYFILAVSSYQSLGWASWEEDKKQPAARARPMIRLRTGTLIIRSATSTAETEMTSTASSRGGNTAFGVGGHLGLPMSGDELADDTNKDASRDAALRVPHQFNASIHFTKIYVSGWCDRRCEIKNWQHFPGPSWEPISTLFGRVSPSNNAIQVSHVPPALLLW